MTQFHDLPIDVILDILDQLATSPSELAALTQVNSALHHLVTPYLYRRMTKYNGRAHRKFFENLERNPSLASLVRVYHTPTRHARHKYLWMMIRNNLYQMNNLKELVFRRQSRFCLPPRFRVLPEVGPQMPPPFQLERFVWAVRTWKMVPALDFLDSQTNLDYLYWATISYGPTPFLGPLRGKLTEYMDRWRATTGRLYLPDELELRWDAWSIPGVPGAGPGQNGDDEAGTRRQIERTPGMKEFRTMQAIRHGWDVNPFITFQYSRQRSLEDTPVFGGDEDWFVEPRPGARHPHMHF